MRRRRRRGRNRQDSIEETGGEQKGQRPFRCLSGCLRMSLGSFPGAFWDILGASWRSRGFLGASWVPRGTLW
eukprot:7371063-Pyramimonas_sp.AAC.1